jgi:ribitol 2-dehydrogenase
MVERDEAALKKLSERHGEAVIPLAINLLDAKDCATMAPRIIEKAGQLDILHANAGLYVGGDLVETDTMAIDRMLNLNINVVMKNVHDALPHMIGRGTGDIIVTSSLAAHFPTPWEPVYASSKWAINCFVQTVRRQVFKHGICVARSRPDRSSPRSSPTGRPRSSRKRKSRAACSSRAKWPMWSRSCSPGLVE